MQIRPASTAIPVETPNSDRELAEVSVDMSEKQRNAEKKRETNNNFLQFTVPFHSILFYDHIYF